MDQLENRVVSEYPNVVSTTTESIVIPVIEETVRMSSQVVETGRVIVRKSVTEDQQQVEVPDMHEETKVERVPVNQFVDTAPAVRYEGDTMIIPVLREEVVVQKRLVLVEEVRITKRQVYTRRSEVVTLRKETVEIDRRPADLNPLNSTTEL